VSVALEGEGVELTIEQEGEQRRVTGSHLFVAVGRTPNSDGLGADAAGIELDDRGFVVVDDYCRTTADGVFAVGDINGHGAFTHTSVNDAEIVLDQMRGSTRKLSDRFPVYGLFIDPALGRVGMTEKEAVAKGLNVLKATRRMSQIGRAKEMGETLGFAKLLVDGDTDLILGAAILGPGGDEIVNMLAAFMYSGLPCRSYRKSVLVHPTISELMPWILDTLKPVDS
jgi:pyruvate/2-oxoglutarate dehydrogenase complex dihydrolipoamide dehydrogenase (E3) component